MQPFVQRMGELLQRESQMINQEDRKDAEKMARILGKAFDEQARISASISHLLEGISMGDNSDNAIIDNTYVPP
jgi:hypothetical protein